LAGNIPLYENIVDKRLEVGDIVNINGVVIYIQDTEDDKITLTYEDVSSDSQSPISLRLEDLFIKYS
jgi:tartrate dehydratase beta subunit/fumarate hydratase class I family protein